MDPKLKALATEYEKARKQNLQLRQALQSEKDKNKALSDEVEQLKNRPMLPVSSNSSIFFFHSGPNFVEIRLTTMATLQRTRKLPVFKLSSIN